MSSQAFQSNGFALTRSGSSENDHTSKYVVMYSFARYVYLIFDTAGPQNRFNVINSLGLRLHYSDYEYTFSDSNARGVMYVHFYGSSIDVTKLTFSNAPQEYAYTGIAVWTESTGYPSYGWHEFEDIATDPVAISLALRYGLMVSSNRFILDTPMSLYKPELIVNTLDTLATGEINAFSPSDGSIDLGSDNIFSFSFAQKETEPSIVPLAISSFKLQWRVHGSSTVKTINVTSWTGESPNCTVPAGTFSGDSIDWCVVATTNAGQTLASDWMTLSTVDAAPTAIASSPNGNTIDRSIATTFRWSHVISSGTLPTKSELQASTDGETWTALATINGNATGYMVPADTFPVGQNFWRVRTYNTGGVASEWSDPAQFYALGAPSVPIVSVKSTAPRPEIAWQAEEQQAYEVEIVGTYTENPHYGTDKAWKCPIFLDDGAYTVRVRVQNAYGYWSAWGTAALPVSNTPGAAIELDVYADDSAQLSWQSTSAYDYYLIYRDDVLIAKSAETYYTDPVAIGTVAYQVRGCYSANANYGLSNTVDAVIRIEYVTVSDLEAGTVLQLKYSDSAHRTTNRVLGRNIQSVQLAGHKYPIVERAEHYFQSITVACAFCSDDERNAFLALNGKMVAVRTPEGAAVIGCLQQLTEKSDGGFYSVYTFTVEQSEWEEAVDIDS